MPEHALLEVASDEGPRVLLPELGAVERLLGGALILPGARLELLPQPARMIRVIGVELPRLTWLGLGLGLALRSALGLGLRLR